MTTNTKLDFTRGLTILSGFFTLIAMLIVAGNYLSNERKQIVYNQYANETQIWISQNREGLRKLFTELFPDHYCPPRTDLPMNTAVACPNQSAIVTVVSQDLKDWSSTEFIKEAQGRILVMRLSGDVLEFNPYPDEKKNMVYKLLRGELQTIPWDNYTNNFQGKEVIVPIADNSGKVLGAIVRGVIEQ